MIIRAVLAALLLSVGSSSLSSQSLESGGDIDDARLRVGDRVRVTAPALGLRHVVGQLSALRADTLFVAGLGPIPGGAVTRLDVSAGRRSAGGAAVRGAGYGAAIGGGLGLVVLAIGVVADMRGECQDCMVTGTMAGAAALVVGLGVGTLAGGIIGAAVRPEQWRTARVPLSAATPAPAPRRLRVGLSLTF